MTMIANLDPQTRLLIEHSCARLIQVYCLSIDAHDVERLLGVFAEDATWQRPGSAPLLGHSQIRKFVEHHGAGEISAHYVTNIVVDVRDDANASSTAYALVFRGAGSRTDCPLPMQLPRLVVKYTHRFVCQGGHWYIKYKETQWLFRQTS